MIDSLLDLVFCAVALLALFDVAVEIRKIRKGVLLATLYQKDVDNRDG